MSSPADSPRYKPGTVLGRGRYELLEVIARSGATVFRARDQKLVRTVAVKVAYPRDEIQRARLIREARIGAQLHHTHLMPVLDFGLDHHCVYIVMPYVMGPTLSARINAGPLAWLPAGIFIHQLLAGLAVLHSAGVVHRDVKSGNCLLWQEVSGTRLLLADFGVARVDRSSLAGLPSHRTSEVMGSIGYMAPERVDSQGDARSDVYSAGIVLFEALTRMLPFRGQGGEVLRQHAEDPPPAPSSVVDVPRGFDELIATALAKQPEHRFQTVGEFDAALLSVLGTTQAHALAPAGAEHALHALQAYADSDVTGALKKAGEAATCDLQWRYLRELLEVVHASEQPPRGNDETTIL